MDGTASSSQQQHAEAAPADEPSAAGSEPAAVRMDTDDSRPQPVEAAHTGEPPAPADAARAVDTTTDMAVPLSPRWRLRALLRLRLPRWRLPLLAFLSRS